MSPVRPDRADGEAPRFVVERGPAIVVAEDGTVLAGARTGVDPETAEAFVRFEAGGVRGVVAFAGGGEDDAYEELRVGFTAAVSHELRTPLARLGVLLESAELPGADVPSLLAGAGAEIARMSELIDDILFLSQLETGREVVSLGPIRVLPVLQEVVADLAETAERAGIALRAEGDGEVELPLRARMLRVVASNLAENALRYAGDGATCVLSIARRDGAIELAAIDDGAGLAAEHLPRLFERFYRADPVRSARGTGLGLAIVKHVVVAAGGTVDAEGAPGRGLVVRCRFLA